MIQTTLSRFWADFLTFKPETGMGYQVVRIRFKNGATEDAMVFASQVLLSHVPIDQDLIADLEVLSEQQIPNSLLHKDLQ